jgi:hypothetical protein
MTRKDRLTSSSEWNALLVEADASRRADLSKRLAASLLGEDLPRLISLLNSVEESAQLAALKVLMDIARSRRQLFKGRGRASILSKLRPRLVDPAQAEEFLTENVKVSELTDRELATLIADLSMFSSSSRAISSLREIAKKPGPVGKDARRRLQNMGFVSEEEIVAMAKEWRETRSRDPLNRLFNTFISRQGELPIEPVLKLLGPPSEHKDSRYFYHTSDGLTLFLEQDDLGRLKAMRIK